MISEEMKYTSFKVNGAGTIRMNDVKTTCKNEQGIHIGVSWGKHGFVGGNIPKDEAIKLATHILKCFGFNWVQIDAKSIEESLIKILKDSESMFFVNPWISVDDKNNKVPNDPSIQVELLFDDGTVKDFDDHHPFEIITHWRIKKQIIGYENDSQQ